MPFLFCVKAPNPGWMQFEPQFVCFFVLLLSNIMHTSHVCVTLTSLIYFSLTLAQGKRVHQGERELQLLTSVLG